MNARTIPTIWIIGLAAGLMGAPDRLVLMGNSLGTMGMWLIGALAIGLAVHAGTLRVSEVLSFHHSGLRGEVAAFGDAFGPAASATIVLGGRLPLAIFGQPGRLIMGGVVIVGTFAAVNALFFAISRMAGVIFAVDVNRTRCLQRFP